jgi:hypothetical protein
MNRLPPIIVDVSVLSMQKTLIANAVKYSARALDRHFGMLNANKANSDQR